MPDNEPAPHPIDHVDALKAYEWMLAQCAAADERRQALEDGLVGTVAQISSAAILAVPGIVFASGVTVPKFESAPALYIGLVTFGFALMSAMAEQHLSSLAYAKHVEVVRAYYTKQSTKTADESSRQRVRRARWICYLLFAAALLLTTSGLLTLKG